VECFAAFTREWGVIRLTEKTVHAILQCEKLSAILAIVKAAIDKLTIWD